MDLVFIEGLHLNIVLHKCISNKIDVIFKDEI